MIPSLDQWIVQKFNVSLISMLVTLLEKPKSTWREQVPTLVHAYNYTKNNVTCFNPYYLMFGHNTSFTNCYTLWNKHC